MNENVLTSVLAFLRTCLHVLVAALLALASVRAVIGEVDNAAGVVAVASVVAVVYGIGPVLRPVRTRRRAAVWWLAALVAAWLVLLALTPDGIWLAFPFFFIQLHLLPPRRAMLAVAVTTVLAIAGFGWHTHELNPGTVIGPVLGAAVAVAVTVGYQALYAESEQRRRLIEELTAARNELAGAEHAAGVLAERERLGREIHDTLAQGLSSIQLLLRAAERALPAHPDAALGHVEHARQAAADNLAEVRRFVHALSPPALEFGSLPAALQRLCATTTQVSGLEVHCQLSGTPTDIPTSHETAMLRVAQSALANAVQHSHATHAELTLSYMDTEIALDIVDDGRGFDPDAVTPAGDRSSGSGFGLAAMRARAQALQGSLAIESTPGRGTALAVTLPLPGSEVADA